MKNLKNILGTFALVAVLAFGLTSCGNKDKNDNAKGDQTTEQKAGEKTIEQYLEEVQSKCPATIGEGITMKEINYDGEVYETVIEVTPEILAAFQQEAEQQQAQAVASTKAQYNVDPFTKMLVDKGVTMVIRYVSGEDEFVIEMPAEDLK